MDRIMVAVAIGMALVFAIGVVLGVIAMVSMASNREDRLGTLTRQPPDAAGPGGPAADRPRPPRHHAAGYRGRAAMSTADVMAIIFFAFFLAGVAVGVVVVAALSARRAHKAVRRISPAAPPPSGRPYVPEIDDGPDEPSWWQTRGD